MKRTKRKSILFSKNEWETVCDRAEYLKMKPATFIRNMSLHNEWKRCNTDEICLLFKKVNRIGTDLNMILKVAENTNSEHLEKLKSLKKRFEKCRSILYRRYAQLLNND